MRSQLTTLIALAVAVPMVPALSSAAHAQAFADRDANRSFTPTQRWPTLGYEQWSAPLITNASRKACREREAAQQAADAQLTGAEAQRAERRRAKSRCR